MWKPTIGRLRNPATHFQAWQHSALKRSGTFFLQPAQMKATLRGRPGHRHCCIGKSVPPSLAGVSPPQNLPSEQKGQERKKRRMSLRKKSRSIGETHFGFAGLKPSSRSCSRHMRRRGSDDGDGMPSPVWKSRGYPSDFCQENTGTM